ncbi:hypothetical protein [Rhodococcus sp. NPDC057529]|uniref:hypothetical protein n=1 Tax=Rhodococcus sp. NPDC057529 TaxID=3346158 RepID=UPI0036734310
MKGHAEIDLTAPPRTPIIVHPRHFRGGAGDGLNSAALALRETDIRDENLAGFIVEAPPTPTSTAQSSST